MHDPTMKNHNDEFEPKPIGVRCPIHGSATSTYCVQAKTYDKTMPICISCDFVERCEVASVKVDKKQLNRRK